MVSRKLLIVDISVLLDVCDVKKIYMILFIFIYLEMHSILGRFWMDNMQCNGNETEIINCRFEGWGKNDCDASEAAGVVCTGGDDNDKSLKTTELIRKWPKHRINKKYELEIRLAGGRNKYEGQVEVGPLSN